MTNYDLARLDPQSFQQLVNMLALRVLGAGTSSFSPGPDGGRDGWFHGAAPYPSAAEQWEGTWYIQSKFHRLKASSDEQKWLVREVKGEIEAFNRADSGRSWPDIWIVASNVDPSAVPDVGTFDTLRELVKTAYPPLADRFHIWGGTKILALLAEYPDIASYYGGLITSGQVLTGMYKSLLESNADLESIIREFTVTGLGNYQYTKLDQAGSSSDTRPGIHEMYTDLPYENEHDINAMVAEDLALSSALDHSQTVAAPAEGGWQKWARHPQRSRVWFIKGGPGQGKSTSTQFVAQVHRAAIILSENGPNVTYAQKLIAQSIQSRALKDGIWPSQPRIPVTVELREYAQWFGSRSKDDGRRILVYIAERLEKSISQTVNVGTLKGSISKARWLFVFDGLDEVPSDVKNDVAEEIIYFVNNFLVGQSADAQVVCTSRPQGYAGQFDAAEFTTVDLAKLNIAQALECAEPVIRMGRTKEEGDADYHVLVEASENETIQEIMTTPLQSHIMAVVVRGGSKPPERKWQLFQNFYEVMRKREAARNHVDTKLADILLRGNKLIKNLHARLGFELHARAETSSGATTSLSSGEFRRIVTETVESLHDQGIDETVEVLMEAATERLVLVNTPENATSVRFDIRPLQEFFAAEYILEAFEKDGLEARLRILASDSHWREVMHFYLSALVENDRKLEISTAVSVLMSANSEVIDDRSRELSLRLALGSIQGTRLLSEGVLDQDKRVRNIFRPVIEPIAGCLDAPDMVGEVFPRHSRSWLIDCLMAACKENAEPESVGAFLVLTSIVSDDDPRGEAIEIMAEGLSSPFKQLLLTETANRREWDGQSLSPWIGKIALRMLCDQDWLTLEPPVVYACMRLLRSAAGRAAAIASGWTPSMVERLDLMVLDRSHIENSRGKPESVGNLLQYRYIDSRLFEESKSWDNSLIEGFISQGGYFEATAELLLLRLGLLKVDVPIVRWISENRESLYRIPLPAQALLSPEFIQSIDDDVEITPELFESAPAPQVVRINVINNIDDEPDWPDLLGRDIGLARYMLMNEAEHQAAKSLARYITQGDGLEYFKSILSKGELDDALGLIYHFFAVSDVDLGAAREALLLRAGQGEPIWVSTYGPLKFPKLPEDSVLLPYFVALTAATSTGGSSRRRRVDVGDIISDSQILPLVADLESIGGSDAHDGDVRAAAYLLAALGESDSANKLKLVKCAQVVLGSAQPEWAAVASLLALTPGVMADDPASWAVASSIIDSERNSIPVRKATLPILARWRERSGAPVQAAGWLT